MSETGADEVVDLVDADDAVVGQCLRSALRDGIDRWRIVTVLVVEPSTGDVLLAQRAWNKRHQPGVWSPSVAGTVTSGEGYLDTVARETAEELGIDVESSAFEPLHVGAWTGPSPDSALRNIGLYRLSYAYDIAAGAWDRTEAAQLAWWPIADALRALDAEPQLWNPYLAGMLPMLAR